MVAWVKGRLDKNSNSLCVTTLMSLSVDGDAVARSDSDVSG